MLIDVLKIFAPVTVAFFVGIAITPLVTHYLYKYKLWKQHAGKSNAPIFNELHKEKEIGTPRFGGVIIWGSVVITTFLFWLVSQIWPTAMTEKLDFLSRNQTWLPLFTLVAASLIGLADDWLEIKRSRQGSGHGGLAFKYRLVLVFVLGLIGAWWFYTKLDVSSVMIPFWGELSIGWWIVPLFVVTMIGLFSSGVIDGLDGLAGGVMAIIFSAYSAIAFFNNQIDLAALSAVLAGATLAFLWFNIPPARFYMSETGILGLTTTLTVIAFLSESVLVLPIVALPLFVTVVTNLIQIGSKKLRGGKKVFRVAPIHHHFEAIGWPAYKVVMRYWVISIIAAVVGLIIFLLGK